MGGAQDEEHDRPAGAAAARRRSAVLNIPAVSFLAAGLLASCNVPGQEKRACVDPANKVISEVECTRPGGIGRYYYYRGSSYRSGSTASGGSYSRGGSKSAGASSRSIGRGGFGGGSSGG